jgi:DNA polymerase II large subunit
MAQANTAFCVRCKATVELKDAQQITMKNGRPALKGKCTKCGTSVFRILPSKK